MNIPRLLSQERVLNAIPSWLRLICTTRRDAKVLAEFRFPAPGLLEINAQEHIFLFDMHHIISDGTSMGILVKEFVKLYEGEVLPELGLQYKDYAEWHNELLQTADMKKQEAFWLERLSGELPVLDLPTDYPRPAVQTFEGSRLDFRLPEETLERIKELAASNGGTLYMVLLAVYTHLLSRYSGQEDIIVGTGIAGRPHADLQHVLGMFVNTLAMRNRPQKSKTFRRFLAEVKEHALQAYEHQDYPFEEIIEKLAVERDVSRNPVFDAMMILQNMDLPEIRLPEVTFSPYAHENRTSKFDLSLYVTEEESGVLHLSFEYSTRLFKRCTIEGGV
jgi:hypothetical protein